MTAWTPIAAPRARRAIARDVLVERVAIALLAATVLFNPLLAIVNAHVHRLGSAPVAGVQALLVAASLGLGALVRPRPLRWLLLAWGLAMAWVLLALLRGVPDPKALGDALLVPAFVCLGTALMPRTLLRLAAALQAAVIVVGFWELLDPEHYGALFKVLDYYVATRGYSPSQFYNGGDLFVSADRGGGRYLMAFTGWHRGSSLFLEPVSLGNWAAVVALVLAAFWDRLGWRARGAWFVSILATLVICDGRLGLGVCAVLALAMPLVRRVPGWVSVYYLPGFILALDLLLAAGALPQTGDTLSGRVRGGIDLLNGMSVAQMAGVGGLSPAAVDAGWVFLVETQSIAVALALWLCVTLSDLGSGRSGRAVQHGVAIFVLLCMPISYAVFSVKTSALMWALFGCFLQAERRRRLAEDDASAQ